MPTRRSIRLRVDGRWRVAGGRSNLRTRGDQSERSLSRGSRSRDTPGLPTTNPPFEARKPTTARQSARESSLRPLLAGGDRHHLPAILVPTATDLCRIGLPDDSRCSTRWVARRLPNRPTRQTEKRAATWRPGPAWPEARAGYPRGFARCSRQVTGRRFISIRASPCLLARQSPVCRIRALSPDREGHRALTNAVGSRQQD